MDVKTLEKYYASKEDFEGFEPENINVESLLFQTGYLTIKEIIDPELTF